MTVPTPEYGSDPGAPRPRRSLKLSMSDKLGLSAGLLAFVASFLPWYRVTFEGGFTRAGKSTYTSSGWEVDFGGWFPVLLLVLFAVLIGVRAAGVKMPEQTVAALPLAQLSVAALAAVVILLRWLTFSDGSDHFGSAGASYGLFVGLFAALIGSVGGWLAFKTAGYRLPSVNQPEGGALR